MCVQCGEEVAAPNDVPPPGLEVTRLRIEPSEFIG